MRLLLTKTAAVDLMRSGPFKIYFQLEIKQDLLINWRLSMKKRGVKNNSRDF